MKNRQNRRLKAVIIVLSILLTAALSALGILYVRSGFARKTLVKLGLRTDRTELSDRYALMGWQTSLESMRYDADVVFFGDSMTWGCPWEMYFPDRKVCNLGYRGDTVGGLISRTGMVRAVAPEKVFILIGGNNMKYRNYEKTLGQGTRRLVGQLREENPDAKLYMISILPTRAPYPVENRKIVRENSALEAIAQELDVPWIDLYDMFTDETGELAAQYSRDGVHLTDEGNAVFAECLSAYVYE